MEGRLARWHLAIATTSLNISAQVGNKHYNKPLLRDPPFFMGRGVRWFLEGMHPKIFELKGGTSQRLGGDGVMQVYVLA